MDKIHGNSGSGNVKANRLFVLGYEPVPITPGQKYPTLKGWPTVELPIRPWPKNYGIGLRTGKLTGIDIDIYSPRMVAELLTCFDGVEILTRVGQPPKTLIPVICPEVTGKVLSDQWVDQNGVLNRIEILSHGQQFVAYGIHPDTGKPYEWSGDLLNHSLPVIPMAMIEHLFSKLNELAEANGWTNISAKEKKAERVCRVRKTRTGNKPGDLYNLCCPITDVLREYGWKHYRGRYWTRPGKKHGVSGTVFEDGTFWCFSSATCLEPDRSYDNFGLLTMYEYAGDFAAAARALRQTLREVA